MCFMLSHVVPVACDEVAVPLSGHLPTFGVFEAQIRQKLRRDRQPAPKVGGLVAGCGPTCPRSDFGWALGELRPPASPANLGPPGRRPSARPGQPAMAGDPAYGRPPMAAPAPRPNPPMHAGPAARRPRRPSPPRKIRSVLCAKCWSPTGVRSRSARSGPSTSSAPPRSPSSPTRTATRCTARRPTRPTRSARTGPSGRAYLDIDEIVEVAQRVRAPTRSTRATASCPRTRSWPEAVRRGRHHLHRAAGRGARPGRQQGAREAAGASAAGVPVLAAHRRRATTSTSWWRRRRSIGFPLFVKAVAGGGGRGMRRVGSRRGTARRRSRRPCARRRPRSATRRCSSSRPSQRPRHIEVQILADAAGDVVHLFERDCSVQRRHQKVVEIAPAPNLDRAIRRPALRRRRRVRRAVGYVNAGTVEFLVDPRTGATSSSR